MSTPDPNLEAAAADPEKLTIELAADQVPEQFRANPGAVFKSYEESRKEMDRLRSELDDERAQFQAALERIEAAQPQPQAHFEAQSNPMIAAYQQAVEAGDAQAMLAIQIALSQQATADVLDKKLGEFKPQLETQSQADRDIAFTIAQDRVRAEYGDRWAEIAPDVNAWLHEHSAWLPTVNSPDAFAQVIREGAKTVEGAKAQERLAAIEADRAAKLSATTATGGGAARFPTVTDDKKQAWDEIKSAQVGSYGSVAKG